MSEELQIQLAESKDRVSILEEDVLRMTGEKLVLLRERDELKAELMTITKQRDEFKQGFRRQSRLHEEAVAARREVRLGPAPLPTGAPAPEGVPHG